MSKRYYVPADRLYHVGLLENELKPHPKLVADWERRTLGAGKTLQMIKDSYIKDKKELREILVLTTFMLTVFILAVVSAIIDLHNSVISFNGFGTRELSALAILILSIIGSVSFTSKCLRLNQDLRENETEMIYKQEVNACYRSLKRLDPFCDHLRTSGLTTTNVWDRLVWLALNVLLTNSGAWAKRRDSKCPHKEAGNKIDENSRWNDHYATVHQAAEDYIEVLGDMNSGKIYAEAAKIIPLKTSNSTPPTPIP